MTNIDFAKFLMILFILFIADNGVQMAIHLGGDGEKFIYAFIRSVLLLWMAVGLGQFILEASALTF